MSAPRKSYELPNNTPIADSDGRPSEQFQQTYDQASKTLEILRQAAALMTDLDPGTATAGDVATAWEAFRAKLQEIV